MDGALLAARLLLAVVFAVAALSKLADLAGSRQAVVGFGLPESLARPLGVALPIVELAIALALVAGRSAWAASVAALVLLGLFIAAISISLARGQKPNCHCFGQLYSEPVGWTTLARNGILAAIGAFYVAQGPHYRSPSAAHWLTQISHTEQIGLALAIVLFVLLIGTWGFLFSMLQQNGRLLARLETIEEALTGLSQGDSAPVTAQAQPKQPVFGLPIGTPAPDFSLSGLYGETMTLQALRAQGIPVLLMFTDPSCIPCGELLPDVGHWQTEHGSMLTVALISRGTSEANRGKMVEHGVRNVLLQQDDEVAQAYQSPGTPSALIVQPDGTIGTPVSAGPPAIRSLVASATGTAAAPLPLLDQMPSASPMPGGGNGSAPSNAPAGLQIGDPAPAIKLKDLSGKTVDLAELRDENTMLLFWNTGCGFCQQMLPDLKEWEKSQPADAPRLVVISAGSLEDNRAMALKSTVLLDPSFQAGQAFGANGTPMGVLLDTEGKVASQVGAGAPGVWALLPGGPSGLGAGGAPAASSGSLKVGDPVPSLALSDLDGKSVDLAELKDKTMLLFWSLSCGFCQQMLPDLQQWEKTKPRKAPDLVVISNGSVEENRAMGLTSRVVIDPNFQAGPHFGANGTPMAVIIEQGKVASEIGAGAPGVWNLVGGGPTEATMAG